MLLIDGVRYEEWIPTSEEELEEVVKEHTHEIFGEQSIFFDKKQKLKSVAGVGSIPDGLVIVLGNTPRWNIVEVELSSHDPYQHVVPQLDRFIVAIDNPRTRNQITDALYKSLYADEFTRLEIRDEIGHGKDIHKFLADLIATSPTITIVVEEKTDQLDEALRKYTQKSVVEFRTFRRIGAEAVHAHLFEPLVPSVSAKNNNTINKIGIPRKVERKRGLKRYVKDGKPYNPKGALEELGAILSKIIEGRGDLRASLPDGTVLEYIAASKNGKSKIRKVHEYLINHGFVFE